MLREDSRTAVRKATDNWWWFIVAGVIWLLIAVLVLRFEKESLTTVGVLMGVVFLISAFEEFVIAYVRESWRWAHILLAIAFVAGGIWCFVEPIEAFWALAAVFGLLLILRGSMDIIASTMAKDVNPVWGLGLLTGILEILLGFWASQQYFPARATLVLIWVGFYAIFRGIASIVIGFEVRSGRADLEKALDTDDK
jgi:uncharacterized membrane protein HdeD (DUF308 family)